MKSQNMLDELSSLFPMVLKSHNRADIATTHLSAAQASCSDSSYRTEMMTREQWNSAPLLAGTQWLITRRKSDGTCYAEQSKTQYRAIWHTYIEYLREVSVHPLAVESKNIKDFLDTIRAKAKAGSMALPRTAKTSTKVRYLRLLNEVYVHLVHERIRQEPNPCSDLMKNAVMPPDELPHSLWLHHHEIFIQKVIGTPVKTWRDIRDRAMLLLCIGSSLYPGEILALTISMLRLNDDIPHIVVPAHGRVMERAAPVLPFAVDALQQWFDVREALDISDEVVFVSGKRHGKTGVRMLPATFYRKVRAVLDDTSGVEIKTRGGRGPQVLRNAFFMRQFENRKPLEHVQLWAGHALPRSTKRHQRLVPHQDGICAE